MPDFMANALSGLGIADLKEKFLEEAAENPVASKAFWDHVCRQVEINVARKMEGATEDAVAQWNQLREEIDQEFAVRFGL